MLVAKTAARPRSAREGNCASAKGHHQPTVASVCTHAQLLHCFAIKEQCARLRGSLRTAMPSVVHSTTVYSHPVKSPEELSLDIPITSPRFPTYEKRESQRDFSKQTNPITSPRFLTYETR